MLSSIFFFNSFFFNPLLFLKLKKGKFDPGAVTKNKEVAVLKKKAQDSIKAWVMELLPEEIKADIELVVTREFQCGDPKCAPIVR